MQLAFFHDSPNAVVGDLWRQPQRLNRVESPKQDDPFKLDQAEKLRQNMPMPALAWRAVAQVKFSNVDRMIKIVLFSNPMLNTTARG